MFGYIVPNYGELKVRELQEYRSWYCGLCKTLQQRYGRFAQMTLNYDMTFLGMLLSGLYDCRHHRSTGHCLIHPVRRHPETTTKFLAYVADMNVLLAAYKCQDDWLDEHKIRGKVAELALSGAAGKIAARYPGKCRYIRQQMDRLHSLELECSGDIDQVAGCFGNICGCVFSVGEDIWKEDLWNVGYYLGSFVYLMDAWEDLEQDVEKDCYNPLRYHDFGEGQNRGEAVRQSLMLMMGNCTLAFERLPVVEHIEILRNILYSGVWTKQRQKECGHERSLRDIGSLPTCKSGRDKEGIS